MFRWVRSSTIVNHDGVWEGNIFRSKSLRWSDVAQIACQKIDKITYEENFLILYDDNDTYVTIGELDKDFHKAENIIKSSFEGFPSEWRSELEGEPAENSYKILWTRKRGANNI